MLDTVTARVRLESRLIFDRRVCEKARSCKVLMDLDRVKTQKSSLIRSTSESVNRTSNFSLVSLVQ